MITTLCYLEKDEKYLMLHRTKKKNDINKGKTNFETFAAGYLNELEKNPDFDKFLKIIKSELLSKNVTVVFASKTPEISHIPILKKYLENKL